MRVEYILTPVRSAGCRKRAATPKAGYGGVFAQPRRPLTPTHGGFKLSSHKPKRIQRKRTKGWKTPTGAVFVGQPSKWDNPFAFPGAGAARTARQRFVDLYRQEVYTNTDLLSAIRRELRGKDLMCWCSLDHECHADVILEIANG